MKIGILTSSRADFGIYIPLLQELRQKPWAELEIIAFGTHISREHGYTISEIEKYGFENIHTVDTISSHETPLDVSKSIGQVSSKFSNFWDENEYDLVICLGDRYEMYAAVSSSSPFAIKVAHIHAGETTLGAIDNAYRHSISLFSKLLFTSAEPYAERAKEIVADQADVYNVGALSIDNLRELDFMSVKEFEEVFGIDMNKSSILSTIHPETVNYTQNETYIETTIDALRDLSKKYQIIVTLPNADTMGNMMRAKLLEFGNEYPEVHIVESFGMRGYLSCMKYCAFMLGNTSSGFIEASYFPKWVINLGTRQKGRILTPNIINRNFELDEILDAVSTIENNEVPKFDNIYGDGHAASKIVDILEKY